MPRSIAQEQDILKLPAPKSPPQLTSRRIGIHTSTSGGVETAAERAYRLGCNTFQIFSSSPRQWKPYLLGRSQCDQMRGLREKYGIKPLVFSSSEATRSCCFPFRQTPSFTLLPGAAFAVSQRSR